MKESGRGPKHGSVLHLAAGREWRGGERQVWLLMTALAERGLRQQLITMRGSELARRAIAASVPVHEVTWNAGLDPRVWWAILQEIRPGAPSLVHAHDGHALRLATWAFGLRGSPPPLVVTRRVTFPLNHPAAWRRSAAIIAISQAVRVSLLEGGLDPARVHVVPSAISLADVSQVTKTDIRTPFGWEAEVPVALNVAALTEEKGHRDLLEAAAQLQGKQPSLRWIVAGDGPLRAFLEAEVQRRGLSVVVRFAGHVREVERWIASATVLVSSSQAEGFGSSLLDALALGTPVVATSVGGVPEVLADGAGVLVDDAAGLADGVDTVLRRPDDTARRIARGRVAVQRFDVNPVAERTLAVYRSVGMEV